MGASAAAVLRRSQGVGAEGEGGEGGREEVEEGAGDQELGEESNACGGRLRVWLCVYVYKQEHTLFKVF